MSAAARPAGAPEAVVLRDVVVRYGRRTALDGVSLAVAAGERVGLVGPSGAGKSTLLGLLDGLVPATSGTVEVLGADLSRLRGAELVRLQARIGTVHQRLELVGPLQVVHNVSAGQLGRWSTARALWSLVRPQEVERARAALAAVGLVDRLRDRTDTLSGGQQQRVALARVLAQEPDLVLADEPVSALDPALSEEVVRLLATVTPSTASTASTASTPSTSGAGGRTLVASLHDTDLARRWCDRLVGLREGRVLFDLPAARVGEEHLRRLYAGTPG